MTRTPIVRIDGEERVVVPSHLLGSRGRVGDHYVLRVVGDSMIEEGIQDGDFVVVLRNDQVAPGEMVVVLVGDDATLRRYYHEDDGVVRLESANKSMPPTRVPADQVRVQGIAVGLMRKW